MTKVSVCLECEMVPIAPLECIDGVWYHDTCWRDGLVRCDAPENIKLVKGVPVVVKPEAQK